MDHSHTPVTVDQDALKNASANWDGFVQLMKWGTVSVIVILAGMAAFLV
jgi:hypothetical protein